MFNFIKNLFKKEKETEEIVIDIPEVEEFYEPDVDLHETFEAMRKSAEETDVLLQRAKEISNELDGMLKRMGIVHKFRNPATGEVYVVEPGDHETFNKMMLNKELQMVFD